MKPRYVVAIVLALSLTIALWRWPRKREGTPPEPSQPNEQASSTAPPAGDLPPAPPLEWGDGGRPSAVTIASARRRADAVRARLAAQHAGAAPNYPSMPAPIGSGNQKGLPLGDYLDDIVRREFMPVAEACYVDLLHEQPDAGGSILLDVAIAGDPSVGGVVDSVQVDAASTLARNEFVTCVRESMMAMSFKAPPNGKVTFTLPLDFAP